MKLTSTPVMTELKDTFSFEELLPDVLFVEVDTVEPVGEGKEVVGEVTTGSLIVNLLLIGTQSLLHNGRLKLLTFIPRTFS